MHKASCFLARSGCQAVARMGCLAGDTISAFLTYSIQKLCFSMKTVMKKGTQKLSRSGWFLFKQLYLALFLLCMGVYKVYRPVVSCMVMYWEVQTCKAAVANGKRHLCCEVSRATLWSMMMIWKILHLFSQCGLSDSLVWTGMLGRWLRAFAPSVWKENEILVLKAWQRIVFHAKEWLGTKHNVNMGTLG